MQQEDWPDRLPVQVRVLLLRRAPLLGQARVRVRFQGPSQGPADQGEPDHRAGEAADVLNGHRQWPSSVAIVSGHRQWPSSANGDDDGRMGTPSAPRRLVHLLLTPESRSRGWGGLVRWGDTAGATRAADFRCHCAYMMTRHDGADPQQRSRVGRFPDLYALRPCAKPSLHALLRSRSVWHASRPQRVSSRPLCAHVRSLRALYLHDHESRCGARGQKAS